MKRFGFGMEQEDEGQGSEWSVVERHRKRDHESSGASIKESMKRAKVRSKGNNGSDDETTGPHLHPIRLTNAIEKEIAW